MVDAGSQLGDPGELAAQAGHERIGALALAAHEAVVRRQGIADALNAALQLALELVAQGGQQSAAQLLGAGAKFGLGLAALARQQPQADARQHTGGEQTGDIRRSAADQRHGHGSQTHGASLEQRRLRYSIPH